MSSPTPAVSTGHPVAGVGLVDAPKAYREVWDASVPPGGYVCADCGVPVESEPCADHGPALMAYALSLTDDDPPELWDAALDAARSDTGWTPPAAVAQGLVGSGNALAYAKRTKCPGLVMCHTRHYGRLDPLLHGGRGHGWVLLHQLSGAYVTAGPVRRMLALTALLAESDIDWTSAIDERLKTDREFQRYVTDVVEQALHTVNARFDARRHTQVKVSAGGQS